MDYDVSEAAFEELRIILEKEGKYFSIEEVRIIGRDLIEFFQILKNEESSS